MPSKLSVPKHWLFAISSILWLIAGVILLWRSYVWLCVFPWRQEIFMGLLGIALGIGFYFLFFIKIAQKNIRRILSLPESVCLFAFTAWKGYAMIAIMITLGIVIRNSSLPKQYLSDLYTAMGCALLLGSFLFYKTWYVVFSKNKEYQ